MMEIEYCPQCGTEVSGPESSYHSNAFECVDCGSFGIEAWTWD